MKRVKSAARGSRRSKAQLRQSKSKGSQKLLLGVGLLIIGGLSLSFARNPMQLLRSLLSPISVFSQISGSGKLHQEDQHTNLLLLGEDRREPDSRGLTDTIMVASIGLKTKKATLISLPRDLWVPGYGGKINSIYPAHGTDVTAEAVGKILGIPIHYYAVVDFAGFEQAVDTLGGIEVDVETAFDDYFYPVPGKEDDTCGLDALDTTEKQQDETASTTPFADDVGGEKEGKEGLLNEEEGTPPNEETPTPPPASGEETLEEKLAQEKEAFRYTCRYEHIHFDAGLQLMDGETALKYARSRHASGSEGTDFARSRRQQNVIRSAQAEALSLGTLFNPQKLKNLYSNFVSAVETNLSFLEAERLFNIGLGFAPENVQSLVIDGGEGGGPTLLVNPPDPAPYGNQWVLVPQAGDFSEIQALVQQTLFE